MMRMATRHRNPPLNVRPDGALKAAAQAELERRDREMTAFVTACLTAVSADPDGFLSVLEPYWPAPTPMGRPRREANSVRRGDPDME